jgi:hypothetical protein
MSDVNVTNNFYVSGHHNTVTVHQEMTQESTKALGMVLKFLVTILLAPIAIPFLLTVNGYRMLTHPGEREVQP